VDERNRPPHERDAGTQSFRERYRCCDGNCDTDTDTDSDSDVDGNADTETGPAVRRDAAGTDDADAGGFQTGWTDDAAPNSSNDGNALCADATRDEVVAEETARFRALCGSGVDRRAVGYGEGLRKAESVERGIGCSVAIAVSRFVGVRGAVFELERLTCAESELDLRVLRRLVLRHQIVDRDDLRVRLN
jgi:hypothetical protein